MATILWRAVGAFLLLCGLAPLVYRIWNFGTLALCVLGVFFLFLPALWRFVGDYPRFKAVLVAGLAAFFLYSGVMSAMMAYKAWFNHPPQVPDNTEPALVVVLGAHVNADGVPSLMLRRRLDVAYTYLIENPEAVCVVTGGQGADEPVPEAHAMRDYLLARGIAPQRILVEDKSTSTRDNFRFAAVLCSADPPAEVIVVTDSFHQMRASIFARSAFPVSERFYALSSYTPWGLMPSYWVRDMLGIVVAWVQTAA